MGLYSLLKGKKDVFIFKTKEGFKILREKTTSKNYFGFFDGDKIIFN